MVERSDHRLTVRPIGLLLLLLVTTVRTDSCRIATGSFAGEGSGSIEIETASFGEAIDADGYTVVVRDELGGTRTRSIGTDGAIRFSDLRALLEYTVELDGVGPNCEVTGEDRIRLFLDDGEAAVIAFDVVCRELDAT
jgi:hypothetical protein